VHLSGRPVKTAAALLVPTVETAAAATLLALASCTALGTATRFIGKSLGSEELLLSYSEGKILCALHTGKGFV